MKINEAIRHFGSAAKIARILGYTDAAVAMWAVRSKVVPFKSAIKLVKASEGELAISLKDYE